ncbi:MAG: hypothetical protein PHC97_03950 [Patescibacteria group bacterium]|nr:hypothetical protein [Patescibacteria group bacterium]
MIRKCKCGWIGVNLIPELETDQALCPNCKRPFPGVTADEAIMITSQEEKGIIREQQLKEKIAGGTSPQ